jgi:hypothetical protein
MYKQGKCVYLAGLVDELVEEQGKIVNLHTAKIHANALSKPRTSAK